MKRLFLVLVMLIMTGCSQDVIPQVNKSDDGFIINQIDYREIVYNNDFIAVTLPVQQTAFYDTQTQLYSLDDNQLVASGNYKSKDISVGLYNQGFYTVSLTSNKVTLYATDGTKISHTIHPLFQKEDWAMATLSPDASTLVYVENNELKQYDITSKTVTQIPDYEISWEVMEWKEECLYFNDTTSNAMIEINTKDNTVNRLLEETKYHYLGLDYSIALVTEETFEVYDMQTLEKQTIYTNKGETIVDTNTIGLMTQLESTYYYYDLETMLKYTFCLEDVKHIYLLEDQRFILITNAGKIQNISIEEATKVSVVKNISTHETRAEYIIDAPIMAQLPNYPTGCETISTMMLLEYLGKGVDTDTFIDEYLDITPIQFSGGVMYAPNPNDSFVGSPRIDAAYGCMSPVIEKALVKYLGSDKYIENTTGLSLEELCQYYINRDIPVVVWASINMLNIYPTSTWVTPDGSTYQWLANEHCLLLVGYDNNYYYFNDPWTGRLTAYSRSVSQSRYATFGQQSLTIIPHE